MEDCNYSRKLSCDSKIDHSIEKWSSPQRDKRDFYYPKYTYRETFPNDNMNFVQQKICFQRYSNIIVIAAKRWTFMQKTIDHRIGGILTGDKSMCFLLLMTFEISQSRCLWILNATLIDLLNRILFFRFTSKRCGVVWE